MAEHWLGYQWEMDIKICQGCWVSKKTVRGQVWKVMLKTWNKIVYLCLKERKGLCRKRNRMCMLSMTCYQDFWALCATFWIWLIDTEDDRTLQPYGFHVDELVVLVSVFHGY